MKTLSKVILTVVLLTAGGISAEEPAEFYQLICEPVDVVVPPGFGPEVRAPRLSVVNTNIKPKRTRLLLDGRAIGRAGDFNGKPGPLFLRPGRYRIEAVLGGYRTTVFEVTARSQCLFKIKHRMSRISGTKKESSSGHPELIGLSDDIYGPLLPPVPNAQPVLHSATALKLTLRPDLTPEAGAVIDDGTGGGCLIFDVDPDLSAVYLNGAFVASVAELEQMEQPLAVGAGEHLIEIVAPGYEAVEKKIILTPGQKLSVEAILEKTTTGQERSNDT